MSCPGQSGGQPGNSAAVKSGTPGPAAAGQRPPCRASYGDRETPPSRESATTPVERTISWRFHEHLATNDKVAKLFAPPSENYTPRLHTSDDVPPLHSHQNGESPARIRRAGRSDRPQRRGPRRVPGCRLCRRQKDREIMDSNSPATLARRFSGRCRLQMLAAGLFALGPLAGAATEAQTVRCKTPCSECTVCQKRKRKGKNTRRKKGACVPRPDGTPCAIGSCFDGLCIT